MCDRTRMIIRSLALFLLLQISLAQPEELQCKPKNAKICQLDAVLWERIPKPKLPDLSSKHTLVIRSGSIASFSKDLTSQLGGVTKLHLGQLKITSLYISPQWTSLKAEFNLINELHVEELVDAGDPLNPSPILNADGIKEEIDKHDEEVEEGGPTEVPIADNPRPTTIVNELVYLNLANNKLQSVDNLRYLTKLKELLLDGNRIKSVNMITFASMRDLKKLSLTNNEISRIETPQSSNFPALEKLSLAFNELTKLHVKNWKMLQLIHLDVSHNQLTGMDVATLDQFESLEKLAMAKNSWHCEWLSKAVATIGEGFVQLEDSQETCAKEHFEVKGYCCKFFLDEPVNTLEKINRMETVNKQLRQDLTETVGTFQKKSIKDWESLQHDAENKMRPYKQREESMPKDDNRAAEKAIEELTQLIRECEELLRDLGAENKRNKEYTQKFTKLFYTTLAEKNKLIQEMSKAAALEEEMKRYETSFKANN